MLCPHTITLVIQIRSLDTFKHQDLSFHFPSFFFFFLIIHECQEYLLWGSIFISIFRKSHEENIKEESTLMSNQSQKSWSSSGKQEMNTGGC